MSSMSLAHEPPVLTGTTSGVPGHLGWLAAGLLALGAYWQGVVPPLPLMVCLFGATTVWALVTVKVSGFTLLPRLMILVYALPFSALAGYLFDGDFAWWETPALLPLCQDHPLNSRMLMMAWVGLFGLVTGMRWSVLLFGAPPDPSRPAPADAPAGAMLVGPFLLLLLVALLFSWMYAPQETILTVGYGTAEQGKGSAIESGFCAANLVSYVILILLFVDSEREPRGSTARKLKTGLVLATSAYIVVVLQMLRGDRESAGLIAGLAALYLTAPGQELDLVNLIKAQWDRLRRVATPLALLVVVFFGLGFIRSSLTDSGEAWLDLRDSLESAYRQNTWTAVALTNLALAAEMDGDHAEYYWGKTYLDYLASLPPGFLAQWVDYERSVERDTGPGTWYIDVTAGGIHVAVVPYKNFGILGVFCVLGLYGMAIAYCELRNATGTPLFRTVYGAMTTSSFMWFWYGDMAMIRGLMAVVALVIVYRFLIRVRPVIADPYDAPAAESPQPI